MYVRLLQVINNVDGQFVSATPMRGAVLVFIADLMQRWTSDRYKSVVSLKDNTDLDPLIKNITTIHDRLPVIIFSKIQPLATSTSVNHCYLLEQKKVFTEEKRSISHRISSAVGLGHQRGRRFIVLGHQK